MGDTGCTDREGRRIVKGDPVSRAVSEAVHEAVKVGLAYGRAHDLGRIHLGADGSVRFEPTSPEASPGR